MAIYGIPTEEELIAQAIRAGMGNPYSAPTTMQSQVNAQLQQLDPANMQGMPQAPQMPAAQPSMEQLMATAGQDFSEQDRRIKDQMAYANQLRGTPVAQGKTVGPSGLYVAPNWAENLETVVGRGLGGYLSGKAQEASEELQGEKDEAASALAKARQMEAQRGAMVEEEKIAREEARFQEGINQRELDREQQRLKDEATRAEATAREAESLRRWEATQARLNEAAELAEKRATTAEEKAFNADIRKFGDDINKSGIPKAQSHLESLNEALAPYADRDPVTGRWSLKEGVDEIPGIGGASNAPLGIGEAITFSADAIRKGSPGKDIKQLSQKVYNQEIKDLSGSAVSAHEMLRNLRAQGVDIWSDANNFIKGVNAINDGYAKELDVYRKAARPEVIEEYDNRFARESGAIAAEEKGEATGEFAEGTVIENAEGKRMVWRNGKWEDL